MRTYVVTRDVSIEECPWLERDLKKGESIRMYTGERKASSGDYLLCKFGLFDEPFEVPENALIDENWLKNRPRYRRQWDPNLIHRLS